MKPGNELADQNSFEAVALWCGISVVLALLVVGVQPGSDSQLPTIWVIVQAVLAMLAAIAALIVRAGKGAELARLRLADMLGVFSALAWGVGAVMFGRNADAEYNLPTIVVVSGLAGAAVWLFRSQLILSVGILVCLLAPTLFQLLLGGPASLATAALVPMLVITNLLISRRVGSGGPISQISPALAAGMTDREVRRIEAEAKFQADRINTELRSDLERHKNIEDELKNAKQAAEAAAMAKGEFLATMSHEIRTPLNGIIPLLEILKDTKLAPDQREYLVTAYNSSKHLLRIIDDILDFSKIEANKLELEQVGVNLREILDSVVRLMDRAASEKNLRMSVQIEPGVRLAVRGDPVRLRQILTNLVSNAIKFTERGSVTIQVSKRGETRSHNELLFAVRDTGIGIAADHAERLFRPFQQADTSTTRQFGGTGLGLVICKRLVDLMGGKIGVKTELGKGSIFWFSVPMLKAIGDVSSGRRDLSGGRALLIGTEPKLLQRLQNHVAGWGMTQVPTSTTADALSKLKSSANMGANWAYDIAIVDLAGMRSTAQALARSISREPALENLKLLYVLGSDGEELPAELKDPRADALGRNFSEGALLATLNRLMEIEAGAGEKRFSLLEEAAQLGFESAEGVAQKESGAPLGGHVLLVEDNPVNRQVAQRLIGLIGLTMEIAENGKEAVEKLLRGHFDAVLMDCQMPVMDGYTATRTRRTLEEERKLKRIPIIAMTANAMAGDREKCLNAGMDDYLSKPLNKQLLETTLRKWVPSGAQNRSLTATPVSATAPPLGLTAAPASVVTGSAPPMPIPQRLSEPVKMTAPKAAAIDRGIFDELLDVMGEEFAALVKVYLEDTPKNLKILSDAADRGDVQAMIAPAHSLKSTSANLGAMALSEIAKQIEHGARGPGLPDPVGISRNAQIEFQRTAQELKVIMAH